MFACRSARIVRLPVRRLGAQPKHRRGLGPHVHHSHLQVPKRGASRSGRSAQANACGALTVHTLKASRLSSSPKMALRWEQQMQWHKGVHVHPLNAYHAAMRHVPADPAESGKLP